MHIFDKIDAKKKFLKKEQDLQTQILWFENNDLDSSAMKVELKLLIKTYKKEWMKSMRKIRMNGQIIYVDVPSTEVTL